MKSIFFIFILCFVSIWTYSQDNVVSLINNFLKLQKENFGQFIAIMNDTKVNHDIQQNTYSYTVSTVFTRREILMSSNSTFLYKNNGSVLLVDSQNSPNSYNLLKNYLTPLCSSLSDITRVPDENAQLFAHPKLFQIYIEVNDSEIVHNELIYIKHEGEKVALPSLQW